MGNNVTCKVVRIGTMRIKMYNGVCRDNGPKLYIAPWALVEVTDWSEDE